MVENDLPAEAITDARIFTDDAALHGMLARLRRIDPLPRVASGTTIPFWLVTRHADISAIEMNPQQFISAPRQAILPLAYEATTRGERGGYQEFMRNLVAMDGSEHRAFRAISQSRFLSKALNAIRLDIEELATEFVDRMAVKGETCDFAGDIAMWYPLRVIMTIIGVPREDEALMLRLTQQQLSSQDPEFADDVSNTGLAAIKKMFEYFQPIIADRRQHPREDLASIIANAQIDGAHLADRDVFGYLVILATAGHDTTSYSLAGGLLALLQHPDQMAMLRADPALLASAVDEIVRWTSPVRHFVRTAVETCEVAGKTVAAGDVLLLSYPSANRDAAVFDDPFAFRVDRKPNRHLAFGTGPHLCLGQHLAKMELVSFFRAFLERIEQVELAGAPRFTESTFVSGVKELPIRYRLKATG